MPDSFNRCLDWTEHLGLGRPPAPNQTEKDPPSPRSSPDRGGVLPNRIRGFFLGFRSRLKKRSTLTRT